MNCFEWRMLAGDYSEGLIPATQRKLADSHLDTCKACKGRLSHLRELTTALSHQPRQTLPMAIRKAPLAFTPPRIEALNRKSRWETTPWLVRSSIEGLSIGLALLMLVIFIPRARNLYERSLERRLDAFSLIDFFRGNHTAGETENPGVGLSRGKVQESGPEVPAAGTVDPTAAVDDFAGGENGEDTSETTSDDGVQVGRAEVWRFNIKTESPREMRPKIVNLLLAQGLTKTTAGIGGVEYPGGIQFDLLVTSGIVANLRPALKKIAIASSTAAATASAENDSSDPMSGVNFTWYKNKSKRPMPAGKTKIIIWLSQM